MRWDMPRSIVAIFALGVAGALASAQNEQASVDPRMAGVWELAVGADRWQLEIAASGAYTFSIRSATTQPGHSGTFTASGGRWNLTSTAGTPWTDGGAYEFADQDTVVLTGKLGAARWTRRRAAGAESTPAGAASPRSVARVMPCVVEALALARAWRADAVVTGVFVKAGADGRVDLERLIDPQNPHGGYLAIYVHSPAAAAARTYGIERSGHVAAQGPEVPAAGILVPIPGSVLDLDEALAKARERGFSPPPADGRSFIDANLAGVTGAPGRPDAAIWAITAVDMSGAHPSPGARVTIDAATGVETTREELSGQRDRERLADELRRGRTHPLSQRDWAFYRQEADAFAASWDPTLRFCGVELSGKPSSGRFEMDRATFVYVTPPGAPGSASLLSVGMFPTGEGMLIRVDEFDHRLGPQDPAPPAAPEAILAPEAAAARLLAVDPRIPVDPMILTLVSGDALSGGIRSEASRAGRDLPPALAEAMKGRFLWIGRSMRIPRQGIGGLLVCGARDLDDVAIDAASGEPFLRRGAAASKGPRGPRRVDPAIVGAWSATLHGRDMTMELGAAGEISVFLTVAGSRGNGLRGALDASGGRWEVESSDGEVYTGAYRLIDGDTLEWTDPKDGPITFRRTMPHPR